MADITTRIKGKPLELQAAFTQVTEGLADALLETFRDRSDWRSIQTSFESWDAATWELAPFVANVQGIAPLLFSRLHSLPAWELLSDELREFVAEQYQLNGQRMQGWQTNLQTILREANARHVDVLLMKGCQLATAYYGNPAERVMADIDLLVKPRALSTASEAFAAAGYPEGENMQRHLRFLGPHRRIVTTVGEHPDNVMDIEAHTRLADLCFDQQVDLTELLSNHWHETSHQGERTFALTAPALFVFLLLHGGANVMRHTWRLIQMVDVVLVARRLNEVEWGEVARLVEVCHGGWWAYASVRIVENYLPGTIPAALLRTWQSVAPGFVRNRSRSWRITDVTLSNLSHLTLRDRLQWARTPAHAIQYLVQKALPTPAQVVDYAAWQHEPTGHLRAYKQYYRVVLRWLRPAHMRKVELHQDQEMEFYRKVRW